MKTMPASPSSSHATLQLLLIFAPGHLRALSTPAWPDGTPAPKCGPKVSRPITPTKTAAFEAALARGHKVPSVLLARTFDAGNIGAAARGMLNFGLWDLRLIDPTGDPQSDEAVLRASGAAPLLKRARVESTLPEAADDLQLVLATTARPRESRIPVYGPREAIRLASEAIDRGERVGLLFGSEKNGLSNDELACAHAIVTLPTNPGFSSLNLAQAVLLVCYEWASAAAEPLAEADGGDGDGSSSANVAAEAAAAADDDASEAAGVATRTQLDVARDAWAAEEGATAGASARAPVGMLESLFGFWDESLWRAGFFGGGRGVSSAYGAEEGTAQERSRAAAAMGKLRRLLLRAQPSVGEASLLRGALTAMMSPKAGSALAQEREAEAAAAAGGGGAAEEEEEWDEELAAEIAALEEAEERERRAKDMAAREDLARMVKEELAREAAAESGKED